MNANEVIESYVRDVGRFLPRGKRGDVAFELRALLGDELAAKAEASGAAPDTSMAMALLKSFGRPAEVAGRYHQRSALIEPADTHHFLIWTLAGAASISVLLAMSSDDGTGGGDLFLKWLGALVIVFACIGWWRRRHPEAMGWKPTRGPDWMPRKYAALALIATLIFPLFVYAAPQTFVRVMFLEAIPTSGVELTDVFRQSAQRIAGVTILVLLAGVWVGAIAQGGLRSWMHWTSFVLYGSLGLLMGAHGGLARQGLVFTLPKANEVAAPVFGVVGAFLVLCALYELYQEWARISPAPAMKGRRV